MAKGSILIWLVIFLILANIAIAATIYGTVYDLSLDKIKNARVEINSVPKQLMVAQNGTYSFNVPNGAYTIKAYQIQRSTIRAYAQENITVTQPGRYILDLILFPDVEEGVEDVGIDVNEIPALNNNGFWIVLAAIVIFSIAVSAYFIFKKNKQKKDAMGGDKKELKDKTAGESKELSSVIDILKKEGGRATQKDIRKEMPLSEAKISLMIAELEHKGIVEKIKRGRGNIIILKK